jgi:hypothetical protein
MPDRSRRGSTELGWGVAALPQPAGDRVTIRSGTSAAARPVPKTPQASPKTPQASPKTPQASPKPPAGGSAVPPPPDRTR